MQYLLLIAAFVAAALAIPTTQHYGYIEVNPQYDANIFYWFFESQNDPSNDPLVMWMTGGPGCSSELALFFENGPYKVADNMSLYENPFGWNKKANLLFIDQPVGTGFSYANSDYVRNEKEVGTEMYAFLQGFLAKYPKYANLEFFIVGESYGGHYVPAVGAKIVTENANLAAGNLKINLKGVGIGNGWVDPLIQYGAYGSFGYQNKLISADQWASINNTYEKCSRYIQNEEWEFASFVCGGCMQGVLSENPGLNYYDIRKQCNPPPLCYNFDSITKYLNLESTQTRLGVKKIEWSTCNDAVNELFSPDRYQSYRFDVPTILSSGARVLVYSGMDDLICNYVGGRQWLESMPWSGQSSFQAAQYSNWVVNGQTAGFTKNANNLIWLEVKDAGHMVPHDQPEAALSLLNTFISGGKF